MEGIEMVASSFRASACHGSTAPKPSGKIGSHHKATDSKPFSPTTPVQNRTGGKMAGPARSDIKAPGLSSRMPLPPDSHADKRGR
jgi:hypothetical protein